MADHPPFRVPRSRVFETHRRLRESLLRAVEEVLLTGVKRGDDTLAGFEAAFAAAVGRRFALGVQSGTAGLFLALRAAGVGPGDEVITVANSDISTVSAITHTGATPVFCDVLASDYTIDPDRVVPLLTPRTRALLPVDLYGHPADVRALRALADHRGLVIIEDGCLATGARDHGLPVGSFAHMVVFSFAPYKPFGGVGNGGAVGTDDPALARSLNLLRGYGAPPEEPPPPLGVRLVGEGYNLPLDPLHAAVLQVKLPYMDAWTHRRQEIARMYTARLTGSPAVTPTFRAESAPTFRQYTIRVPHRDEVYEAIRAEGVEAVLHYVPPMHRQPVYRSRGFPGEDRLPVTEQVADELLCLPVFPEMTVEDVERVVDVLVATLHAQDAQIATS